MMAGLCYVKVTMRVEIAGMNNQDSAGPFLYEESTHLGQGGNPIFVARQFIQCVNLLRQTMGAQIAERFGGSL